MGVGDNSADLLFKVGMNASDAQANLQRFRGLMTKDLAGIKAEFAEFSQSTFGNLSTGAGKMQLAAAAGLAAMVALTAAAVAAGKALFDAAKEAADYAGEIDAAGDVTGLTAEQLSGLRYAAKTTELEFKGLVNSLVLFESAIVKAQDPASQQAEAFQRLGISQKEIREGSKDLLPFLYRTADAFVNIKSAVEEAAVSRDLFGSGGAGMLEFLNLGARGLKDMADEARRLGMVITDENLWAARAFKLEMLALDQAMMGLKVTIGNYVLPYLNELIVGFEAYLSTVRRWEEAAKQKQWWEALIPGAESVAMVRRMVPIFEEELGKARERLDKKLKALMISPGTESLGEPEAKNTTKEFTGLSAVLDQVAGRSAGLAGEIGQLVYGYQSLQAQVAKAREEFVKLRSDGSLDAETIQREQAALAQLPATLYQLYQAQVAEFGKKRSEAVVAATEDLRERLASIEDVGFEGQQAALTREVTAIRERLTKERRLTEEHLALLRQIEEAGRAQIAQVRIEAYAGELRELQSSLANMITSQMTTRERLGFEYERDLEKFSEVELSKKLETARGLEEREILEQQFAMNRAALLRNYEGDLQSLRNSEGWHGVFAGGFAELIRHDQDLLREWSESANQAAMLVRVAFTSLEQIGMRAFKGLAQGMAQNITYAFIYKESIAEAMQAAAAAALQAIAAESIVQAIFATALGFLRLAQHDYPAATAAFKAAGLFGGVGVAAAVSGRAVAPGQGAAGGTGEGAGGGRGSGADFPASEPQEREPRVHIYLQGNIYGRQGIEEVAELLNEAVEGRDVRLIASGTRNGGR